MNEIFKIFRSNADPGKAAPMAAYMRNQFEFLGLTAPVRKELCRDFFKYVGAAEIDWEFVFECWEQKEREFQYLAVDYLSGMQKLLTSADIPNLRKMAELKSWWDTIDGIDRLVGSVAAPRVMLEWSKDKNFWIRRIAIDHQLKKKDKTDKELLAQIIANNFGSDEFFINKAIGWALREYSKTNPGWVAEFVRKHKPQMSPLSIREASKYI